MTECTVNDLRSALESYHTHLCKTVDQCRQKFMDGEIRQAFGPGWEEGDVSTMYFSSLMNIMRLESSRSVLRQLEKALERMKNGDYGICESCGDSIQLKRLRLIPYAALCTACQECEEGADSWRKKM